MNNLLDPHSWNIETLFKCMYIIPVYQRPYSWDMKDQVDVLLNDILANYFQEDNKGGYYTGNIIVYDKDEKEDGHIIKYDIIDGQQRITTFSLILLAVYSLALKQKAKESDSTVSKIRECLWKPVNRECQKNLRVVTLSSIEKKCYEALCDKCFTKPKEAYKYASEYKCESVFDQRIIDNFLGIYDRLEVTFGKTSTSAILDFADYLINFIQFIVIEAKCKKREVFNMFESINSKGKRLEEIDLIKTYIFSLIDEDSYEDYLEKWGSLIKDTKDELYDYLYTYIRAYVSFYINYINVGNFKLLCKDNLLRLYKVDSEAEAIKRLIDDLVEKKDYYNKLKDEKDTYTLIKSPKLRFYHLTAILNRYQHSKPLLFRTLIEFEEGNIKKEDVVDINVSSITFLLKFMTISGRPSKNAISVFKDIMTDIISTNTINKKVIINKIESQLLMERVTDNSLKDALVKSNCFDAKNMTVPLLALYTCTTKKEDESYFTSYDNAYELVKNYTPLYNIDHLLVHTPKVDDKNLKYYKDDSTDTLVLKEGHDFPLELAVTGMPYDTFTKIVLNRIGNLRLYYRDRNIDRSNDVFEFPLEENFYTYTNIKSRGDDIADIIFDICMPSTPVDIKNIDLPDDEENSDNFEEEFAS